MGAEGNPVIMYFHPLTLQIKAAQVVLEVKNQPANARRCKRPGFHPRVGKLPWRRAWQPTPVFLSGESHGQRSLEGYSPQGCKELDMAVVTQHAYLHPLDETSEIFPQLLTISTGTEVTTHLPNSTQKKHRDLPFCLSDLANQTDAFISHQKSSTVHRTL